ncbi:MAG: carboxypeptidase-like regulatory domain-containing protein [Planctomycetes bacterium]|nr:carboxypeptidase-like regulatory domain-containing protein [Planctomycetota bacterium]
MKLVRWLVFVPVVAFVAWWLLGGELAVEDTRPTETAPQAADARSETLAEPDTAGAAVRETAVGGAQASTSAATTAGETLVLHVRERGSQRPVSGATVHVLDRIDAPRTLSDEEQRDFAARVRALEARGTAYTTDANGLVALPRSASEALLCARSGELFGTLRFRKYAKELVVELVPNADLDVLVRDDLGRGLAGVAVFVGWASTTLGETWERLGAVTGADGRARLRDARTFVVERPESIWALRLEVVAPKRIQHELRADDWPLTPLEFDLPPLGAVDVRVLAADDTPAESSEVWLAPAPPPTAPVATAATTATTAATTTADPRARREYVLRGGVLGKTHHGVARFEHVATGLELLAVGEGIGSGLVAATRIFEGPRAAGERLEIELGGANEIARIVGRATDAQGRPIAGAVRFHLRVDGSGLDTESGGSIGTGSNGEFAFDLPPSSGLEVRRKLILERVVPNAERPTGERTHEEQATARVELDFDGDLAPGVHDLGEVVLRAQPTLVSGRVVDDRREPVARAAVSAFDAGDPNAAFAVGNTESGADGSFELRGISRSGRLTVWVQTHDSNRHQRFDVAAGSRDLELVIPRGASVAGAVLVDEALPLADVFVTCVAPGADGRPVLQSASPKPTPEPGRGAYSLDGLPAGLARFEFRGKHGPVLASFDGVALVAGEACADPRLAEVDLRGLAKALHVVARDERGEGIAGSVVRLRGRDGSTEWQTVRTEDGHAIVRARALPIDFVFGASGYRTVRVDGASADFEVTLERGLSIELALGPESLAELGADTTLVVEYEQGTVTTRDDHVSWPELARPDATGLARTRVCEPGRFRVAVRASRERDGRHDVLTAPCEPEFIEVRDSRDPQRFTVRLPEATRTKLRDFRAP